MAQLKTRTTDRQDVAISRLGPHVAAIPLEAWNAIADAPLFDLSTAKRPVVLADVFGSELIAVDDDRVVFAAGLVDRVAEALQRRRFNVRVPQMLWEFCSRAQDLDYDEERLTSAQREFLTATKGLGAALVTGVNRAEQLELLEALCLRFPRPNIVVVVPDQATIEWLAQQLRRRTNRHVQYGTKIEWYFDNMIYLSHTAFFKCMGYRDFKVAAWLGRGPLPCGVAEALLRRREFLIWFGLLSRPLEHLHPVDALGIEAIFGPSLLDFSRRRDTLTTVTVAWLPAPAYPADGWSNGLERKRVCYWRNDARNRQLADVARRLAARDPSMLNRLGVLDALSAPQPGDECTAAVIVENAEHGRQMQRRLPGWQLLDAPERVGMFGAIPPQSIITLPVAAARRPDAEIVIYAAGTDDRWTDGCGPCRLAPGAPLLIIDVLDDVDGTARLASWKRNRDYARRGWQIRGQTPEPPTEAWRKRSDGEAGPRWQAGSRRTREEGVLMEQP